LFEPNKLLFLKPQTKGKTKSKVLHNTNLGSASHGSVFGDLAGAATFTIVFFVEVIHQEGFLPGGQVFFQIPFSFLT
jgi:hypothetical protein